MVSPLQDEEDALTCCCCRADNRVLSSCLPLASKHDLLHHLQCQGRENAPIMSMNDRKDSRRGSRRMQMLSRSRSLLLAFLLVHACSALPLFLVKSGRGKCVIAVAAEGTALQVNYEAPDIIVDKSDPKYGPTWLSIRSREDNKKLKRKSGSTILTEELFQKKGHLTYRVQMDGEVEVCIRASTANSKAPLLFGLNIEPKSDVPRLLSDDQINIHWTHMEDEIRHLLGAMKIIQKEADFSKNRESAFHAQTIAMHAASMWWPIVHVCVLIVTGFTQATHIVRFFKSRRLI